MGGFETRVYRMSHVKSPDQGTCLNPAGGASRFPSLVSNPATCSSARAAARSSDPAGARPNVLASPSGSDAMIASSSAVRVARLPNYLGRCNGVTVAVS